MDTQIQPITWDGFKTAISNLVSNNKSYYFRGQMDSSWKLQTSFHRYASINNISLLSYLDIILPELHYYLSATQNNSGPSGSDPPNSLK